MMHQAQQPPRFAQYGTGPRRSNEWRGPAPNAYNMPASSAAYQNSGHAYTVCNNAGRAKNLPKSDLRDCFAADF